MMEMSMKGFRFQGSGPEGEVVGEESWRGGEKAGSGRVG
jgi:hypothetical protein